RKLEKLTGRDPVPVLLAQGAVVDEHREQLLDEERVPLRRRDDALPGGLRELGRSEQVLGDERALLVGQALELDRRAVLAPAGAHLEEVGPGGAENHERRARRGRNKVLDQVEQGALGPVDVFEGDDERLAGGDELEEPSRSPEDLVERRVAVGEPDRGGDAGDGVRAVGPGQLEELRPRLLGGVLVADAGSLARDLEQRPERDPAPVRKTAPADEPAVAAEAPGDFLEQARLARPGLADDRDETADTVASRDAEGVVEQLELARTPDERPVVPALHRLGVPD